MKLLNTKLHTLLWLVGALVILPLASYAQERIAFQTGRDGNTEIYVMNTDGSDQTRLTYSSSEDINPAFSPDGSKIAFATGRDGNFEIYVMNADGTHQTRLTINSSSDFQPSWSPDASRISFTSFRDGNSEIYVMNADGTGQTRLTNSPTIDEKSSFNPLGDGMIFQTNRDGTGLEIYKMDLDGSNPTNLTNAPGNDTEADWSPDGSKIVFRGLRDGGMDVYLMNSDGSNQVCLTCNNPTFDQQPSFSPGGTKIAFRTDRDLNREVYVMNVDGTNQVNLTNNPADDSEPSWGVANSAPLLDNVAVSTTVNEGGVATLTGDIADSDSNDGFTLTVNWGDGSAPQVFNYQAGTHHFSETHVYEDDTPIGTPADNFTVGLLLSDNRFGVDTDSAVVSVRNVAPSLTGLAATPTNPGFGVPVVLTGNYTDAGYNGSPADEDLKVFVNWGDGNSGFLTTTGAPGSINESHQYALPGSYTVTVKVSDNDTGETVQTLNVVAAPPPPPSAPTNFRVESVGLNTVKLVWTDTSNNEDGFVIEQCNTRACTTFVEIARPAANATAYLDTALLPNSQYSYRLRAFNLGGGSAYTNVITARTLRK